MTLFSAKLPPLLEALLYGDPSAISERIFGHIRLELNLAEQLRVSWEWPSHYSAISYLLR